MREDDPQLPEHGWGIDVKTFSHEQLVSLLDMLKGSAHGTVQIQLRRELIIRARERGLQNDQIVKRLIALTPTGRTRNMIAQEWAEAMGISEAEFKIIARRF